ncbi:hypothetical protein AALA36_16310 [Lachnospiraceae bacterium 66-29]
MNKTLISQLKRYYRHVRRIIPKNYPHRQEILSSIYQDIYSYAIEHPGITYENIISHFGTAEEMALSFATLLSPEDVIKTSIKTKKRNTIIIFIILIALFLSCGMIYHAYWVSEHTIVEIEEKTIIYPETEIDTKN